MRIHGQRKFTGRLHDLTARVAREEQARASEARWQAIVTSAVDGIIVIGARGRIETINPAAERLFGYAEQEVVGQNVSMLMPRPTARSMTAISRTTSRTDGRRSSGSAARCRAGAATAPSSRCTCRSAK
jgi:two-component system, LuxR family, sensor kinase FixL